MQLLEGLDTGNYPNISPVIPELPKPLNITNVLIVWRMILESLLKNPNGDDGFFNPSLNFTLLGLAFLGIFIAILWLVLGHYANNTPANGPRYLAVGNTDQWEATLKASQLDFFLPERSIYVQKTMTWPTVTLA